MAVRAAWTRARRSTSSTRARDTRCARSRLIPILGTRTMGIRHRGQGQRPRFRMLTIMILDYTWIILIFQQHNKVLLFLVIRGMGEYARVKTIPIVITKLNHHSMPICFQKFIVKDNRPLSMVHFSMTMCHERIIGCLADILCCEVCKGIRKLSQRQQKLAI